MITKRDAQVIDFVERYKIARTSTLVTFYPSYQVAARRLAAIVKTGELRRERDGWSAEYTYYIKRPKQYRHSLLVTDYYCYLAKRATIVKFVIEPQLSDIRPDAIIGYVQNGKNHLALLEVEISNKGFDCNKYKQFDWQDHFPLRPELIVITDHKPPAIEGWQITTYNTNMEVVYNGRDNAAKSVSFGNKRSGMDDCTNN